MEEEDRISRTAGNVYQRGDAATWLILPRDSEPYASLDCNKLLIWEEEEEIDDTISMEEVIENIKTMTFKK